VWEVLLCEVNLSARQETVDALEVVGAGSADGDLVAHGQTSIFRHLATKRELLK